MGLRQGVDSAQSDEAKAAAETAYQKAAALLQKRNKAYNDFCEENNLKKLNERIAIAKWGRSQAAKARAAARRYQKDVAISQASDKIEMAGLQFFAKKPEDFPTVILDRKEYAHVMSEIATNITKEQEKRKVFSKPIGKYIHRGKQWFWKLSGY